jgi:hypothetical protein
MCIRCGGDLFFEPLPSKFRGRHTDRQRTMWSHKLPFIFFQNEKSRLKTKICQYENYKFHTANTTLNVIYLYLINVLVCSSVSRCAIKDWVITNLRIISVGILFYLFTYFLLTCIFILYTSCLSALSVAQTILFICSVVLTQLTKLSVCRTLVSPIQSMLLSNKFEIMWKKGVIV